MLFKNAIALTALVLTAYFSLATSFAKDSTAPTLGTFYVISDCTNPAFESVVTVSGSVITAPSGLSFTDFGFPNATIAQSMIGNMGGVTRECTVTYGENGSNNVENRYLYSCFDAGKFKCSIYVQPQ